MCIMAYSISFGVQGHWSSVITIGFEPLGITEGEVGLIGIVIVVSSTISGILLSRYLDYFR